MAKIFLIEDYKNLRDGVSSYLELYDHEVTAFDRARGVAEALETEKPDLIILDVTLPYGDGFKLARQIRKTDRLPILFLTASPFESDSIAGLEADSDDYVVKPFSAKELTLRIEAILWRIRLDGQSEALRT